MTSLRLQALRCAEQSRMQFDLTMRATGMQPRGKGEEEEADGVLLVPSAPPAHTSLGAVLQARTAGPGPSPACCWPCAGVVQASRAITGT